MGIQWAFTKGNIYISIYISIQYAIIFPFVEWYSYPVPVLLNNIINNEINN